MAKRVGISGLPNTGKSFSRTMIENAEDCFVITPSDKDSHLRQGDRPLPPLNLVINGVDWDTYSKEKGMSKDMLIRNLTKSAPPSLEITGNHCYVDDINFLGDYIAFVAIHMPQIKNLFTTDFTHLISNVITSAKFMKRNSGGDAFARYTDLAADTLKNVFKSTESLRDDLLVFTEFHCQMGEEGFYKIFLPAGKMLSDKFLPESYFDIMLYSTVLPYSESIEDEGDRYKFITTKQEPFDARSLNLFKDVQKRGMIPNNMDMVIKTIRKYYNI